MLCSPWPACLSMSGDPGASVKDWAVKSQTPKPLSTSEVQQILPPSLLPPGLPIKLLPTMTWVPTSWLLTQMDRQAQECPKTATCAQLTHLSPEKCGYVHQTHAFVYLMCTHMYQTHMCVCTHNLGSQLCADNLLLHLDPQAIPSPVRSRLQGIIEGARSMATLRAWLLCLLLLALVLPGASSRAHQHSMETRSKCLACGGQPLLPSPPYPP